MRVKSWIRLIRETGAAWKQDNVPLHAAALAYYTLFSLAPLLLIAIAVAGAVYGEEAARGELARQLQGLVGQEGAEAMQSMMVKASRPGSGGVVASVVGFLLLLLGASGVFGQLQLALNTIWGATPTPATGIQRFLISRCLSFAMVLVMGMLLLGSLLLSSFLVAASSSLDRMLPGLPIMGQALNLVLSLGATTVLLAAVYRYLPYARVPWRDLWVGSAVTSVLFNLGKTAIGFYIGNSRLDSSYGAAGSLIALLIWIFYSTQILLIGAEFTQVYSQRRRHPTRPTQQTAPDQELRT